MPSDDSILRPTEAQALDAWRALVAADAEQVARVREPEPASDYYAGVAARFRPGPLPSLELPILERFAEWSDTWLDIGAGGGRFAIPLAARVTKMIAVEPSVSMRRTLAAAVAESGRANVDIRDLRWPTGTWSEDVDVMLAAHALYDIGDIGPFLDAMERHTRRVCIAVFGQFARGAALAPLFEAVHGEHFRALPSLREFVALLGARGRRYDVATVGSGGRSEIIPRDNAYEMARRLLWLSPGSPKDVATRALMEEWWGRPDGIEMPSPRPVIGIVSWFPAAR
jgi:SAM-dependent methyltransferase